MSATTVLAGLHARFATVEGLRAILIGEPPTFDDAPLLYSLLDRVPERSQAGQVTTMRYRFLHRLVVLWTDPHQAEQELLRFVNTIPAAVDADQQLGGTLTSGLASFVEGQAGFVVNSQTLYRVFDWYSETVEKGPYRGGL